MAPPRNYRQVTWNFDPELVVALDAMMENLNEGVPPGEEIVSLNQFVERLLVASVETHKRLVEAETAPKIDLIQLAQFKPGIEAKVRA